MMAHDVGANVVDSVVQREGEGQVSNELVVFTHANPFTDMLRIDERIVSAFEVTLRIKQSWKEGGKGGTNIGFGASVYPSSIVLAHYIEQNCTEVV